MHAFGKVYAFVYAQRLTLSSGHREPAAMRFAHS